MENAFIKYLENEFDRFKSHIQKKRSFFEVDDIVMFENIVLAFDKMLEDSRPRYDKILTFEDIEFCTLQYLNKKYNDTVTVEMLHNKGRRGQVNYARQICMYLCRVHMPLSAKKIGERYSKRDHTTVLHAFNTMQGYIETDRRVHIDIKQIESMLQ